MLWNIFCWVSFIFVLVGGIVFMLRRRGVEMPERIRNMGAYQELENKVNTGRDSLRRKRPINSAEQAIGIARKGMQKRSGSDDDRALVFPNAKGQKRNNSSWRVTFTSASGLESAVVIVYHDSFEVTEPQFFKERITTPAQAITAALPTINQKCKHPIRQPKASYIKGRWVISVWPQNRTDPIIKIKVNRDSHRVMGVDELEVATVEQALRGKAK